MRRIENTAPVPRCVDKTRRIARNSERMRRGLSLFLILFLTLGPLAAALPAGDDLRLPPCCRRHGAHHCAMAMRMMALMAQAESGGTPVAQAPATCPLYPGAGAAFSLPAPALAVQASAFQTRRVRSFIPLGSADAPIENPVRIHAGRGPPAAA